MPHQSTTRSGFTIFEILIVLSIVVVVASLSWPSLMRYVRQASVQSNAEEVRKLLDQGRISAVEEGVTYQFRFEPNGRKFVLLPFELVSLPGDEETSSNSNSQLINDPNLDLILVYELADGCRFYTAPSLDGTTIVTERLSESWLTLLADGTMHADTTWSAPILYYPDGSATDGLVTVMDDNRRYVSLFVRDLTGTVMATKVEYLPELYGG